MRSTYLKDFTCLSCNLYLIQVAGSLRVRRTYLVIKGRAPGKQLVRHDTDCPTVHAAAVVELLVVLVLIGAGLERAAEHLGRHVVQRSGASHSPLPLQVDGEAKVAELEHHVLGEEDVLRLCMEKEGVMQYAYQVVSGDYNIIV